MLRGVVNWAATECRKVASEVRSSIQLSYRCTVGITDVRLPIPGVGSNSDAGASDAGVPRAASVRVPSGKDAAAFVEEDALEHHLQSLRIGRLSEGFLLADLSCLDQVVESLVEALHAVFASGLDGGAEFL